MLRFKQPGQPLDYRRPTRDELFAFGDRALTVCQNNLAKIGAAIDRFAKSDRDQRIPSIPASGPLSVAGIYSARLNIPGFPY